MFGSLILSTVSSKAQAFAPFTQKDILSGDVMTVNQAFLKQKKATVLLFLSARCPCSDSHISEIKSLQELWGSQMNFLAIHSNQNETLDETVAYFKKVRLGFPVINDFQASIADMYKAFKTPHVFVLNPDGEVIYRGGVSSSQHFDPSVKKYLRDVLSDISEGKSPRMSESKSLGCVILRTKE